MASKSKHSSIAVFDSHLPILDFGSRILAGADTIHDQHEEEKETGGAKVDPVDGKVAEVLPDGVTVGTGS